MAGKKGKKKTSKKAASAATEKGYDTDELTAEVVDIGGNEFKVPQDQWAKWNKKQRDLFNTLYAAMTRSPSLFNSHPEARIIDPEQWRAIAWNAAWNAACV